jgi:hypothetical protein
VARRYNRDSRGRFASGGGGGSKRPAARGISRGTNRLTRDNSGRITSVGGDGATARGGRLRTASGNQRATQTARISGGRAAGTVTRSGARRTAAAAAAVKPVRRPSRSQMITPEKTSRIAQRVNQVTANAASKSGVKRLNSTEVGVRAKSFLTKKAGGMTGVKSFEQQQAVISKALAKPTRYSTQKPNRNKPGAYNNLGQANVRRKMNAADKSNNSALASKTVKAANIRANATPQPARMQTRSQGPKAPDTVRTRVNRLRVTQARVKMERAEPDSLRFSRAVQSRNEALRARPAGAPGKVVFRGRNRAVNRQNMQANDLTSRVRMDLRNARPGAFSATAGGGRTGIRRTDTGNRQLSLMGQPATKLYQTKRTKINRPSGKRRS